MKKITTLLIILALLTFFSLPIDSFATGLGIQIPAIGSGTSSATSGNEELTDTDNSHFGFAFVFDTKVANPGVFNYRLQIGYESFKLDNDTYYSILKDPDDDLSRFSADNTFGFAVLQTRIVRLWIGPQIRLSYLTYSDTFIDLNLFGIGLAPVIGANFNMGRFFTLSPELGYRFSSYSGLISTTDAWITEDSEPYKLSNSEFFIKLNIIIRINDYYM